MVAERVIVQLGREEPVQIEPWPTDVEEAERVHAERVWLHSDQEWSMLHSAQPGTLLHREG